MLADMAEGRSGPLADNVARLRGFILGAMLERHLVHFFDRDWFSNPRAGAFFRKLWSMGYQLDPEELARHIGYEGLRLDDLIEPFENNL